MVCWGAERAPEPVTGVDTILMVLELAGGVETRATFDSIVGEVMTLEWLWTIVLDSHMFLQRGMLPERLPTRLVWALELLPALMGSLVSLQPRCRQEGLAAPFPIAHVVSNTRMGGFDMMFQV